MNRRTFIGGLAGSALQMPTRPNLVLFLSDDHGYWDSPVFGNREVKTPNLERIASRGTVFTQMCANSPSCVPSRAILMSGLMSVKNGVQANHGQMKPDVQTLPTYLQELGYQVAHCGKSHFQPKSSYTDMEFVPSEIKGPSGLEHDLDVAAVDRWLTDRSDKRPLCLVVGSHSPHVYWEPNQGYDPSRITLPPSFVDTPETRRARCQYYTDITKMDTQLGSVYDSVYRHLGEQSLFLYTSDNGAQWPFAKWGLYDAGIRMPAVATWPGVLKPKTRNDALMAFVDVLPTFVELAGGVPAKGLDGRSFAGVLRGQERGHRSEVFGTHTADGNMNVYPMRSLRTSRYKYIRNLHPEFEYCTHIDRAGERDGRDYFDSWVARAKTDAAAAAVIRRYHQRPGEELFDLKADPHELNNLARVASQSARLREMRAQVDEWMRREGDNGEAIGTPRLLPV